MKKSQIKSHIRLLLSEDILKMLEFRIFQALTYLFPLSVHPSPPYDLWVEHMNATEVNLYWNMQPKQKAIKLICQIENRHPSGQVELVRNFRQTGIFGHGVQYIYFMVLITWVVHVFTTGSQQAEFQICTSVCV